jgi:carboxypeptidase family protein
MRWLLPGLVMAAATMWPPPTVPSQKAPTLTGRVVMGSGAEIRPVRRAKVTLTGGAGAARVTDTDVKGEYRFDRLTAGDYKLTVEKPGFVKLEAVASPNATLTMVRGGAIEGLVADVNGDPLWNVVVAAVEPQPAGARPKVVAQAPPTIVVITVCTACPRGTTSSRRRRIARSSSTCSRCLARSSRTRVAPTFPPAPRSTPHGRFMPRSAGTRPRSTSCWGRRHL